MEYLATKMYLFVKIGFTFGIDNCTIEFSILFCNNYIRSNGKVGE